MTGAADVVAALAVDTNFRMWGRRAIYRAPDMSGEASCLVIRTVPDVAVVGPATTRAVARAVLLEVRAREIAAPARGGVFKFEATGEELRVVSDPKAEDPDRLVWTMTGAPA